MSDNTVSINTAVIERTFDAPVETIWQMWTQPEHFKQWYGPKGISVPVAEMDVRVGGKHLVCMEMQTPSGTKQMWSTGEYKEIVPNERLVYTDSPADELGNVVSPAALGMDAAFPTVTEVTVVLTDLGGRTKMVVTHTGVPAGASDGWKQAFEKMAEHASTVGSEK